MADDGDAHSGSLSGADDDGLIVESLDHAGGGAERLRLGARRLGARAAHALWGRRPGPRERLARGALVILLVVATLFTLLGGPALTVSGWRRLTFALRSGTLSPPLPMTSWQRIPPPPAVSSDALTYSADPVAPTTAYACRAGADGIRVWRTDTLGANWISAVATSAPTQSCQVKVALDSSARLLLVARSPDPLDARCERVSVYISALTFYSWAPVSLPPATTGAAACHSDVWLSARWLFAWWTDASEPEPSSSLMRSADLGASWQEADGGLPAHGAYLAPALTSFGSGSALLAQVYYWPRHGRLNIQREVVRSLDGGATWEALGRGFPGATLTASLEPRVASVGAWDALYAPVYADGQLAPPWTPDQAPQTIQALDPRAATWRALPPLPVGGAAADRLGVAIALGVGPANTLLALGVDPHAQVTGRVDARDLWLWAWDPAAGEWRLGAQAAPDARLVGFSWGAGPVGSQYEQAYGAYLWLSGTIAGRQTLYSAFVPALAS